MLIPSNLVTKIIGAGGCLIKDIAQRSGGAQIRVHSSKNNIQSSSSYSGGHNTPNEIVVTIEANSL